LYIEAIIQLVIDMLIKIFMGTAISVMMPLMEIALVLKKCPTIYKTAYIFLTLQRNLE